MFFSVIRHHLGWSDDQQAKEANLREQRDRELQKGMSHVIHRSAEEQGPP
jgi:hypothetical protein